MDFSKKILNFLKITKGSKFAVECVSNGISSYHVFSVPIMRFLCKKSEKFERWKNMMKKQCFFEKKSFHLLKLHLYQNGKARNMPLVAGRLVKMAN